MGGTLLGYLLYLYLYIEMFFLSLIPRGRIESFPFSILYHRGMICLGKEVKVHVLGKLLMHKCRFTSQIPVLFPPCNIIVSYPFMNTF